MEIFDYADFPDVGADSCQRFLERHQEMAPTKCNKL